MSADWVVTIVAAVVALVSLGVALCPSFRRYLAWRRQFKDIMAQIEHGIDTGSDAHINAGLARLRVLAGLSPRDDDTSIQ